MRSKTHAKVCIYISSSQASTLASLSVFPLSPTCNWHLLHCLLTYSSISTRLSTGYKRYCGGLPHHSTPSLTMAIYSCTTGRQLIFHWYITVLQVKPISWNVQFNLECHLRHSAVPRHQAYIQLGGWLPPGFSASFFQNTTGDTRHRIATLCQKVNSTMMEGFGMKVKGLRIVEEFDEDCTFPCKDLSNLSPQSTDDVPYTYNINNISIMLQKLGIPWEVSKDGLFINFTTYIGFDWNIKTYQVSLVSAERRNTLGWWRTGLDDLHICSKKPKNFMVNSYTHMWSDPWGKLTSWNWNTCSGYSTIALSYHAPVPKDFKWTWSGRSTNFDNLLSQEGSLNLFPYMIHMPFQMPAQNLESPSPLETGGEHGALSQAGKSLMENEILAG